MTRMFRLVLLLFEHFLKFWSTQNVRFFIFFFFRNEYIVSKFWLNACMKYKSYFFLSKICICYSFYFQAETVQELRFCLQNAIDAMRSTDHPVTSIASGSELFLRFITLATLDTPVCLRKCVGFIFIFFSFFFF